MRRLRWAEVMRDWARRIWRLREFLSCDAGLPPALFSGPSAGRSAFARLLPGRPRPGEEHAGSPGSRAVPPGGGRGGSRTRSTRGGYFPGFDSVYLSTDSAAPTTCMCYPYRRKSRVLVLPRRGVENPTESQKPVETSCLRAQGDSRSGEVGRAKPDRRGRQGRSWRRERAFVTRLRFFIGGLSPAAANGGTGGISDTTDRRCPPAQTCRGRPRIAKTWRGCRRSQGSPCLRPRCGLSAFFPLHDELIRAVLPDIPMPGAGVGAGQRAQRHHPRHESQIGVRFAGPD